MTFRNLLAEKRGEVLVVTIQRPQQLNALNAETMGELDSVFGELDSDETVRAVILTGGGEKAFVAGADIKELAGETPTSGRQTSARGQAVLRRIETSVKPVVAAINGFALGGGLELALDWPHRIGLVNRVVPPQRLLLEAEALLREILANGPLATQYALMAVERGLEGTLDEGLMLESSLFGLLCATEDMREGMKAFIEKRPPRFGGK